MKDLNNIIDKNGKIKCWPSKKGMKENVLAYLAEKFEHDRFYTEKEVNSIIDIWHLFNDYFVPILVLMKNVRPDVLTSVISKNI